MGLAPPARRLVATAHPTPAGRTYTGMFGDAFPLTRYTLSDGRVLEEYVQAAPWRSGPIFYLALQTPEGVPVPELAWPDGDLAG